MTRPHATSALLMFLSVACGEAATASSDSPDAIDSANAGAAAFPSSGGSAAGSGGESDRGGAGAGDAGASPARQSGGGAGAAGASVAGSGGGLAGAGRGGSLAAPGGSGGAGSSAVAPAAAGSGGQGSQPMAAGSAAPTDPVTVYIAGDSTVSTYADTASPRDQAGWGQMLSEYVREGVAIDNRALGGRTARRFIDDGALDEIWKDIHAGDYLLVQFGTNDGNKTATYTLDGQTIPYYLDPATDFKTYLKRYIDGAREHDATPVLVTPPPRNSAYCTGGNGTGAHAQAMRELATAEKIALSDLNERSVSYLKAICPAPDPEDFFLLKSDGSVDGTHFQEQGARKLAELVADGLREAGISWVK